MKFCDVCKKEVPDDFNNSLCIECYKKLEKEEKDARKIAEEEREKNKPPAQKKVEAEGKTPFVPVHGITNPNYKENPEINKPQWEANVVQFSKSGQFLWGPTRWMYEYIRTYCTDKVLQHPQYPKFLWKPKVVDVGCGSGCGANILSQEADFVWGIDKDPKSVEFAEEVFTRVKNELYYSPQVTFDHIDAVEDTREFMKFDLVVAIEIIEHIENYKKFLNNIVKKFAKKQKHGKIITEWFISTPNRNHEKINDNKPTTKWHVREWTSGEVLDVLSEYFGTVKLMNAKGEPILEEKYRTTAHTPLLAHCSNPKI